MMERKYKEISDEVKERIMQMDVVLPSIYASIFNDLAKENALTLEEESRLANEVFEKQFRSLNDLNERTGRNVSRLSDNTDKAISAMESANRELLEEVRAETQALRREIESLKQVVYEDPLTKTHNRKWLNDHFLAKNRKTFKTSGCLVLVDLNYFKQINDTLGHVSGDKVLMYIASQLKRLEAEVVRYGGDEFLLLFPDAWSVASVFDTMQSLREGVLKKTLKVMDNAFKASFAFGIAPYRAGDPLEEVIDAADGVMYTDKTAIKERFAPPF
jgi:diguanylate cyclase